jgi:predicted nucleic acid-binding protein
VIRTAWSILDEIGHRFFDRLLIAAALRAGCGSFPSEDLQHDRRLGGLTIVNRFVTSAFDFFPAT